MSLFHQAERWQQMWEHPGAQRGPGRSLQLADPPAITELLRGEVQMLLLTLRERSSAGGWYVDTCTPSHLSWGTECPRNEGDRRAPGSVWGKVRQQKAVGA